MIENSTEFTNETIKKKINFIGSTPYKISQKSNIKQNKLTYRSFLTGTVSTIL